MISTTAFLAEPAPRGDTHFAFRDFRNIDYVALTTSADSMNWDRIYTLDEIDDKLSFIRENVNYLFELCVAI